MIRFPGLAAQNLKAASPGNHVIFKSMKTSTSLQRSDSTIQNVIRMLRPILEEKELIGTRIKATDLAKIYRNHQGRLPIRCCRAIELAEDIGRLGRGDTFVFDDLEISVYMQCDPVTRRRSPEIEFQLAVSKEQQHLDSLQQQAIEDQI